MDPAPSHLHFTHLWSVVRCSHLQWIKKTSIWLVKLLFFFLTTFTTQFFSRYYLRYYTNLFYLLSFFQSRKSHVAFLPSPQGSTTTDSKRRDHLLRVPDAKMCLCSFQTHCSAIASSIKVTCTTAFCKCSVTKHIWIFYLWSCVRIWD